MGESFLWQPSSVLTKAIAHCFTLTDLMENCRGPTSLSPIMLVSQMMAKDLLPTDPGTLMTAKSTTLSRENTGSTSGLPEGVALKIAANPTLLNLIRFFGSFQDPMRVILETKGIQISYNVPARHALIRATAIYTDVAGVYGPSFSPGMAYWINCIKPSTAPRSCQIELHFMAKGKDVQLVSKASHISIAKPNTPDPPVQQQNTYEQIHAQAVILSCWVLPNELRAIFPTKGSQHGSGREVRVTKNALRIAGTSAPVAELVLSTISDPNNSKYGFISPPTKGLEGRLNVEMLSQLGKALSFSMGKVDIRIYDQQGPYYWVSFVTHFGTLSTGEICVPITPSDDPHIIMNPVIEPAPQPSSAALSSASSASISASASVSTSASTSVSTSVSSANEEAENGSMAEVFGRDMPPSVPSSTSSSTPSVSAVPSAPSAPSASAAATFLNVLGEDDDEDEEAEEIPEFTS